MAIRFGHPAKSIITALNYDVQLGDAYMRPETKEQGRGYLDPESLRIIEEHDAWYQENRNQPGGGRGPAYEAPDVPDNAYHDGQNDGYGY